MYRCSVCGIKSMVIFQGNSLCKPHFFDAWIEQQYNKFLTRKRLMSNESIYEIPTKQKIIEETKGLFEKIYGRVK